MKDELYGVMKELKDIDRFKGVFIDEHGNLAWNNRIDICKDSLYIYSKKIETLSMMSDATKCG